MIEHIEMDTEQMTSVQEVFWQQAEKAVRKRSTKQLKDATANVMLIHTARQEFFKLQQKLRVIAEVFKKAKEELDVKI